MGFSVRDLQQFKEQYKAAGPGGSPLFPGQGAWDDAFVDALCEPAEVFTYGGMIAHVLTFAAHRRTLVVLALDHHGVGELGWGDPMRWVAEPA